MTEDVRTIVLGAISGVIASVAILAITRLWRAYRRRSMREDIEFLKLERQHLEAMKRSGVEMNRSAYRSLFFSLFLFALASTVSAGLRSAGSEYLADTLSMAVWVVAIVATFTYFRRYENLKNFSAAIEKIERKIDELQRKSTEP